MFHTLKLVADMLIRVEESKSRWAYEEMKANNKYKGELKNNIFFQFQEN